eukprot:6213760-Pleurochrysis_carterae.AAC.4
MSPPYQSPIRSAGHAGYHTDRQHKAVGRGGAACLKRRITVTISDWTKYRGSVAANYRCAAHAAPVNDDKCARVIQVDQHALSLLEQLVRREG